MNDTVTPLREATPETKISRASTSDDLLGKLRRRAEATKAIRFRAHVRLIRRHKLSAYVIAMLSIYVIAISLIPTFYKLTDKQNQVLLSCTIVFSTFIIVLVLTEGYESFYHQAHVLHESARAIHGITFTLDFVDREAPNFRETIEEITKRYEDLLRDCPLNHAECDFHWVLFRQPDLFVSGEAEKSNTVRYFVRGMHWCHATIGEFIWLAIPVSFSVLATFVIYEVINGWPK